MLTAGVVLLLLVMVAIVPVFGGWPAVESPPRQGEALDPIAYREHRYVHSAVALARRIREPQNTWTNLAFLAVGAFLVAGGLSRTGRLVGAMTIAVGIGSFLYHASATRTLRHLDIGSMYALFFAVSALAIGSLHQRARAWTDRNSWMLAFGMVLAACVATMERNVVVFGVKPLAITVATGVCATILLGALGRMALRARHRRVMASASAAAVLFTVALICQIGDRPGGWLCAPGASLQAHAGWHVLTATALWITVRALDASEGADAHNQRAKAMAVSGAAQDAASNN